MKTHVNGFQRATMGTLAHLFVIYLYHVNGFQRATMGTLVHLFVIYLYHVNGCRMATMGTLVHLFVIYLYHANGSRIATMLTTVHLFVIYLYHVNGFRMATMRTTATWRAQRQGEGNRMCAGGCATLTGRLSLPCPLPYYIYRLQNRDYPALRCHGKGQERSGQCLDS